VVAVVSTPNLPVAAPDARLVPRLPPLPAPPPGTQIARVVDTVALSDPSGRQMVLTRATDYRTSLVAAEPVDQHGDRHLSPPLACSHRGPHRYEAGTCSPLAGQAVMRLVHVGPVPTRPVAELPAAARPRWWSRLLPGRKKSAPPG